MRGYSKHTSSVVNALKHTHTHTAAAYIKSNENLIKWLHFFSFCRFRYLAVLFCQWLQGFVCESQEMGNWNRIIKEGEDQQAWEKNNSLPTLFSFIPVCVFTMHLFFHQLTCSNLYPNWCINKTNNNAWFFSVSQAGRAIGQRVFFSTPSPPLPVLLLFSPNVLRLWLIFVDCQVQTGVERKAGASGGGEVTGQKEMNNGGDSQEQSERKKKMKWLFPQELKSL